jgi:hypothetical protein
MNYILQLQIKPICNLKALIMNERAGNIKYVSYNNQNRVDSSENDDY